MASPFAVAQFEAQPAALPPSRSVALPTGPAWAPTPGSTFNSGVPGTVVSAATVQAIVTNYFAANPNLLPPPLQTPDGQAAAVAAVCAQLSQENTGSDIPPASGQYTVAGQDYMGAGHWGIDQANDKFFAYYNALNPLVPVNTAGIANGTIGLVPQVEAGACGYAAGVSTVFAKNDQVTDPVYLATLGRNAYAMGPTGLQRAINQVAPDGLTNGNYPTLQSNLNGAAQAAATGKSVQAALTAPGPPATGTPGQFVPTSPADTAAAQQKQLNQDNGGSAYAPDQVIWDGLDNVPWWKLEGALVGNPNLRRIPDAIQFMLMLPPRDTGNYLPTVQGGTQKVLIRLNVGLTSLGSGSSHQNMIEPTATGLLLNVWDSRPDMITCSGTTGVFMNLGGLTSVMSCQQSPVSSEFLEVLMKSLSHLNNTPNGLRVLAQDAFMELWALFKNNGLIRYVPDRIFNSNPMNLTMVNLATNLSGYQMRSRVGDVLDMGSVAMVYKGRTMMGQFKTFDLTANADSPYRWDFNFTFRVLSDFVPYNVAAT